MLRVRAGIRFPCRMATKDDIETLERRWLEAVKERDIELLERLLADEFVLVTGRPGHERRGRREWLDVTRDDYVIESFAFDELEVLEYGDVALARSRYRQRGSMAGQDRTQSFLMSDVFVRRDGRWQAVHRHISPL